MNHIFEITIQSARADGRCRIVGIYRPAADVMPTYCDGELRLDREALETLRPAQAYGEVLGRAVFNDAIFTAFIRARAVSADQLRVLLFVDDDNVRTLRWEWLCGPIDGGWDFLALDQRIIYSLYLPSPAERSFPPIGRRDLRGLALIACPLDIERYQLNPFEPDAVAAELQAAFGDIPLDVLAFTKGAVGPPTIDALGEQLTAGRYTLLHVVCHGWVRRDNHETVLYLADKANQTDPITASALIERLQRLTGRGLPYLTFLATCESASPEAEGAFGGLAQRLIRSLGIPAVLAMTDRIAFATAKALTMAFYRRLRVHGEVDRALVEARTGLLGREDSVVPVVYSRLGGLPLFSDSLERALTDQDIVFGLDTLDLLIRERAPILAEPFQRQAAHVRRLLSIAEAALGAAARDERERALVDIELIAVEVLDLRFHALASGVQPPAYDPRCPFRGLEPFRFADHPFFFGRERLVGKLKARLDEHAFLAVIGPSGCGKSSLVRAGLHTTLQIARRDMVMVALTPGSDPSANLTAQLTVTLAPTAQIETAEPTPQPDVLIVDQFEELFTLCHDPALRLQFIAQLLSFLPDTRVVIVLRADFLGECTAYPQLKELIQAHQELVGPMDTTELRQAVEAQAAATGLRFEAELVTTIIEATREQPGAMPLLQHTLRELWYRRHGRWLRTAEYYALGGVRQAIARTADNVYCSLNADDQRRVKTIFLRLTRADLEATPGVIRRDTRRRIRRTDLIPAGEDPTQTVTLVARLASAGLVVTSVNPATQEDEVEIAHEALIHSWPRLGRWMEADEEGLRIGQQLFERAREWQRFQRDRANLYRGRQLQEAVRWVAAQHASLNVLEYDFLSASKGLQWWQRIMLRGSASLLLLVTVLSLAWLRFDLIAAWTATVLAGQTSAPAPALPAGVWVGYDVEAQCASGSLIAERLNELERRLATDNSVAGAVNIVAAPLQADAQLQAHLTVTCAPAPETDLTVLAVFANASPYPLDWLQEPMEATITTVDVAVAAAFAEVSVLYALGEYALAPDMALGTVIDRQRSVDDHSDWLWGNLLLRREDWEGALNAYQRAYLRTEPGTLQAAQLLANQALTYLYTAIATGEATAISTCNTAGRASIDRALETVVAQSHGAEGVFRLIRGAILLNCGQTEEDRLLGAGDEIARAQQIMQNETAAVQASAYALMADLKHKNVALQIRDGTVLTIQDDACRAIRLAPAAPAAYLTLGRLYADYQLMDAAGAAFEAYGERAFFAWERREAIRLWWLRWHWPITVVGDVPDGLGQCPDEDQLLSFRQWSMIDAEVAGKIGMTV